MAAAWREQGEHEGSVMDKAAAWWSGGQAWQETRFERLLDCCMPCADFPRLHIHCSGPVTPGLSTFVMVSACCAVLCRASVPVVRAHFSWHP